MLGNGSSSTRVANSGAVGYTVDTPIFPSQPSPLPVLPQAPTNCFSREEVVNEILDLTDQVASTGLYGPIGVGKSFVPSLPFTTIEPRPFLVKTATSSVATTSRPRQRASSSVYAMQLELSEQWTLDNFGHT